MKITSTKQNKIKERIKNIAKKIFYSGELKGKYPNGDSDKDIEPLVDQLYSLYQEGLSDLADYTQHERDCILSQWSAGENTADGGYRMKFRDKWYESRPVDKTPKCECGLAELLSTLKK